METKHTPGPWFLDNAEGGDWFRYVMAEDSQIGRVDLGNRGFISQHGEANARLIAAAPELYDALRELLTDMVIAQGNMRKAAKRDPAWEGCAEIIQPRVDAARAAIAKAEGKLCGITSKNADIVQTGDTAGHTGGK